MSLSFSDISARWNLVFGYARKWIEIFLILSFDTMKDIVWLGDFRLRREDEIEICLKKKEKGRNKYILILSNLSTFR